MARVISRPAVASRARYSSTVRSRPLTSVSMFRSSSCAGAGVASAGKSISTISSFALADIAVIGGRGRERSALLNRVGIGPWRTRRFTGEYDRIEDVLETLGFAARYRYDAGGQTTLNSNGNVDIDDLRTKAAQAGNRLAATMITYPSTHGVFEEAVVEICCIIHDHGGQVYVDGANLNALVGLAQPCKIGRAHV